MDSKQRLTLASMWAFEDIGVEEVQQKIERELPDVEQKWEYSANDDVFVLKGKTEESKLQAAEILFDFIEGQRNKDLLDMPRLRFLDVAPAFQDDFVAATIADTVEDVGLLALDDGPDEVIPHPITRVTKFWLSSEGGIGCFSSNTSQEILSEVAKNTGTEISIVDNLKGLQVCGKSSNDVDDAMAKLTRIEKPLACLRCPRVTNLAVIDCDKDTRYSIQNYGDLNQVGSRRILSDLNMDPNIGLGQMFVTILHIFDDKTQAFVVPENIRNSPRCSNEPGKSRIWNDFTFDEIGKAEEFLTRESIIESNHTNTQAITPPIAHSNQYLTPEKAKLVNQWVAETESDPAIGGPSPCSSPRPESPSKNSVAPPNKTGPGIKTRRAKVQAGPIQATEKPSTESWPQTPPRVSNNDGAITSRKRWKMLYEPESGKPELSQGTSMLGIQEPKGSHESTPSDRIQLYKTKVEGRAGLPLTFDATKYGLSKAFTQVTKDNRNNQKVQGINPIIPQPWGKKVGKQSELIDIQAPAASATFNPQPPLAFDHPALIPERSASSGTQSILNDHLGSQPRRNLSDNFSELAGLKFGAALDQHGRSSSSDSFPDQETSSSKEDFPDQATKLRILKDIFLRQTEEPRSTSIQARRIFREYSNDLGKKKLAELEGQYRSEEQQPADEIHTRQYCWTMSHKAPNVSQKTKTKADTKAKKQATLDDAWGIPKKGTKNQPTPSLENARRSSNNEMEMAFISKIEQEAKQQQRQPKEAQVNGYVRQFSENIKPILEAAEAFPGTLTLEIQVGLLVIPLLPKTVNDGLMPLSEWSRIFQPRGGIGPTTKFFNRVTASGLDVDHIVDMKTSRAEGEARVFEQEYSEYNISYEYHCRTRTDQLLVVVIDEQGKHSIQNPGAILGAVNLNFPGQTWDARAVLTGTTDYRPGTNPEFEEAAQYIADHIWVEPNRQNICIYTSLPKGNNIVIEKVFMKRWTHHRHIRADEVSSRRAKNGRNLDDQYNTTDESRRENQDIFLQVMEVQELFMGLKGVNNDSPINPLVRARYTQASEMIRKGKIWYEVTLVSPAIEAILKTNANLEVGERTDDWRSTDLFGRDATLFDDQLSSACSPTSLSPVAAAIGAAGLSDLFRLAKTVVEQIDGVGYWNNQLGALLPKPATSSFTGPTPEARGWDFDELESIKEVESVGPNVDQLEEKALAQYEHEFW